MIYSVVDNNKFGLMLHSIELQEILGKERCQIAHPKNLNQTLKMIIDIAFDKEAKYVLVWNLGISFILLPILKLFGKKVIYTKHEPGSLKSRIKKTEKIVLSMIQHFLVEFYSLFYDYLIVFNSEKITKDKEVFLPLIFKSKFLGNSLENSNRLVYLGGQLETRGYSMLKKIKEEGLHFDFEIIFFPEDSDDPSELSKQQVLQDGRSIIWNFFKVPYNQSGVTLDALRYGVPVILSHYDTQLPDNSLTYSPAQLLENNDNLLAEVKRIFARYDEHLTLIREQSEDVEDHIHRAWRQFFDHN